jgi:hypothetical protein
MGFNLSQEKGANEAPIGIRFCGPADAGDGSPYDPSMDIDEDRVEARDDSTLIFKAGFTNTFAGSQLILDRPMTLKGHNIRIE